MRILHLSDLHLTQTNSEQRTQMQRHLIQDLEHISSDETEADLVLFSGDLVNDPDEPNSYAHFLGFLDSVVSALSIDFDRCVLLPGNHDVSRAALRKNELSIRGLASTSSTELEARYHSDELHNYVRQINNGFFDLAGLLDQPWSNPFYRVFDFPASNISIIALNSTTLCSLEGSSKDHGSLWLPAAALHDAYNSVPDNRVIVSSIHHPLAHFSEDSCRTLTPLIYNRSHLHLFGHVHDPLPKIVEAPSGSAVELQSGALYARQDAFTGYSVIDRARIDRPATATYRTFYTTRQCYDVATNVAPNGIVDLKNFIDASSDTESSDLGSWLTTEGLHMIREEHNEDAVYSEISEAGLGLSEVYVFPPIAERNLEYSGGEEATIGHSQRLFKEEEILSSKKNIEIQFPPEYGATSFLKYIAIRTAERATENRDPRIPIYFDARSQKPYKAKIVRQLKAGHPAIDHKNFGWQNIGAGDKVLFLIDNVNPGNESDHKIIDVIRESFPNARYILATTTDEIAFDLKDTTSDLRIERTTLRLRAFSRARVRDLVKKMRKVSDLSENMLVEEIIQRFHFLGVPLTGPLICMYLIVRTNLSSKAPLNVSSIVEIFVTRLLTSGIEKTKDLVREFTREAFDISEQKAVLAYIAEKIVKSRKQATDYDELLAIIDEYYSKVGISRSGPVVAQQFVLHGILERSQDEVFFKYGIVQSYFVALRMQRDTTFREYVFSSEHFSSFVQELDIYFGLTRSDRQSLEKLEELFSELTFKMIESLEGEIPLQDMHKVDLPREDDLESFQESFSRAMVADASRSEADEALDMTRLDDHSLRRRINKQALKPVVITWIDGLRCLSVALKNLEEIDHDLKLSCLGKVLDEWGSLTEGALYVLGVGMSDGYVEVGDIRIRVDIGREIDGRVLRLLLTALPSWIGTHTISTLATPKLSNQLTAVAQRKNTSAELIRIILKVSLRTEGFDEDVRTFANAHKNSPFVLDSLMLALRDLHLRAGVNDGERDLRQLIAEIDAQRRGLKGRERSDHIAKSLQASKKDRLVRRSA